MVFPVDRPPIEQGVVTIDGERIVTVGTEAESGHIVDLGPVALLPGFVNAHTHLEFSRLQRPLGEPGMPLADWIRLVIAERGRGDRETAGAIRAGLAESLRHGVTAIGEIARCDTNAYPRIDGDLSLFLEVIGFSRARAESAYAALLEILSALEANRGARIGLSPHAPYTVSPELLRRLVSLAGKRGMPVAMHLAESAAEVEFLASGMGPFQELLAERGMWDTEAIPRGSRPMDYLRLLAEAPRALVIHGNYLDEEERAFLAANGKRMSLVYCPRTHAHFAHAPYPLVELLETGVRVALGTDSRASNPDLDLLAEMRFVAQAFSQVDPLEVLRMGTLVGAEALRCAADAGSITPGKLANLVAVAMPEDVRCQPKESLGEIFAGHQVPCAVWHRGTAWTQTELQS
jgi:cytosine/adenosine deaminase-related metal-dependent hydrolase